MWQQLIIVGNVGKDPELRHNSQGAAVCELSIAVNEKWADRGSGDKREKTTWFRVTCWRQLAENAAQYVTKGKQVMVVGTIEEPYAFIGDDGKAKALLKVTAREVKFLGGRGESVAGAGASDQGHEEEEVPF